MKFFGASAGAFLIYDQSADTLEIRGPSADAITSTGKLLLSTALTDINANDVIGKIDFQAPLEAGGTDAITVAASIQAIAQGTFAADLNATDLIFYTGHSEAATEKFRITSQGELGVGGANYGSDGYVLTSTGAGTAPAWEAIPSGAVSGAQTAITTILNAGVKIGRDSQNLIDFATTDNKIIFRVNNVDEVELVANVLQPTTSDGVGLGTGSLMWSDLFLASASVINFNNGDMTITHASNTLTVAGGTLAAAAITGTTIDATTDFTIGTTVITDDTVTFGAAADIVVSSGALTLNPSTDVLIPNGTGLVVGHTGQETISIGDGATDLVPEVQVLGTGQVDGSLMLGVFSTTATAAGAPLVALVKGGNATIGSHTVVTDGEELGNIIAYGDDGTDLEAVAAQIQFEVDGTPGTGDMPGRIILATTADGAEVATERVRIDSAGMVSLADATNLNISTPLLAGTDHTTTGITAQMLAGGAIGAFDLVCIHTTTQEVVVADASAVATARAIGISPAAISDTATGTILLHGFIRDSSWSWTTGGVLYLSETAGAMTHTAPTTDGAFVQVVGIALSPIIVFINPSLDIIEHA